MPANSSDPSLGQERRLATGLNDQVSKHSAHGKTNKLERCKDNGVHMHAANIQTEQLFTVLLQLLKYPITLHLDSLLDSK